MSGLTIVDTESMRWENGLDVVAKMAPEFRANLGPADAVARTYVKYTQKTLRIDPKTTQRGDLIHIEPGYADLTLAYHDSVEECLFLGGECFLYGEGQFRKGDYFWRPPGWVHSARTRRGFDALLFLEGVSKGDRSGPVSRRIRPAREVGTNPVHRNHNVAIGPRGWVKRVNTSLVAWQRGPVFARSEGPLDGYDLAHVSFKVLSKNPRTGAQSLLVRLHPGYCQKGWGRHSSAQQFFVLSGSLAIGDAKVRKGGYVYREARSVQPPMTSREGAEMFMKVNGWLDFRTVKG